MIDIVLLSKILYDYFGRLLDLKLDTVEPGDSKPVDSKFQDLVNFLLLTKINNHNINHMIPEAVSLFAGVVNATVP